MKKKILGKQIHSTEHKPRCEHPFFSYPIGEKTNVYVNNGLHKRLGNVLSNYAQFCYYARERYILVGNYESLILKLKQSQQQRTCSDLNLQHVSTCCTCSLHVSTTSTHFHTNTAYNPPERIWHKRKLR